MYTGTVRIVTSQGELVISMSVEVLPVEIPDTRDGLKNAPMFALLYEKGGDRIERDFGYLRYSAEWWHVLDKLAVNAVRNRTNVAYIVQHQLLADGGSTVNDTGKITFNWSLFDRYVQFFLDRGMRYIWSEGLAYRSGADAYVITLKSDGKGGTTLAEYKIGSREGSRFLQQYMPALRDHLQEKGWTDLFYTQIFDESPPAHRRLWLQVARLVPPQIKIIDTFYKSKNITLYEGKLDAWVPWLKVYEDNRRYYDELQKQGYEKWVYTFGHGAETSINRLIDGPVYNSRLMFWLVARFNIDGFSALGL